MIFKLPKRSRSESITNGPELRQPAEITITGRSTRAGHAKTIIYGDKPALDLKNRDAIISYIYLSEGLPSVPKDRFSGIFSFKSPLHPSSQSNHPIKEETPLLKIASQPPPHHHTPITTQYPSLNSFLVKLTYQIAFRQHLLHPPIDPASHSQ